MMLVRSPAMVMLTTTMAMVMTLLFMLSSNQYVIAGRMTKHDGTLPSLVSLLSSGVVIDNTMTKISPSSSSSTRSFALPTSLVNQLSDAVHEDRRALSTASIAEWNTFRGMGHNLMYESVAGVESGLISTSRDNWSTVRVTLDGPVHDIAMDPLVSSIPMTTYPVCDTSAILMKDQSSWKSLSSSTGMSFFALNEDGIISDDDINQLIHALPGHMDATSWRVQSIDHQWSRYPSCDQHLRDQLVYVHHHKNNEGLSLVFHRYIDSYAVTERTTHEWTVVARSEIDGCRHQFSLVGYTYAASTTDQPAHPREELRLTGHNWHCDDTKNAKKPFSSSKFETSMDSSFLSPTPIEVNNQLRVMTYNVWNKESGAAVPWGDRINRLADNIRKSDPDLIGLQEVRHYYASGQNLLTDLLLVYLVINGYSVQLKRIQLTKRVLQ